MIYVFSSDLELKRKAGHLFGIRFDDEKFKTLKGQLDMIYKGRDLVSHNYSLFCLTHPNIFICSFNSLTFCSQIKTLLDICSTPKCDVNLKFEGHAKV